LKIFLRSKGARGEMGSYPPGAYRQTKCSAQSSCESVETIWRGDIAWNEHVMVLFIIMYFDYLEAEIITRLERQHENKSLLLNEKMSFNYVGRVAVICTPYQKKCVLRRV
ncbi:MAG: hypothetical protein P8179_25175, partial [Candidatus Thiodiazotropha sp.]